MTSTNLNFVPRKKLNVPSQDPIQEPYFKHSSCWIRKRPLSWHYFFRCFCSFKTIIRPPGIFVQQITDIFSWHCRSYCITCLVMKCTITIAATSANPGAIILQIFLWGAIISIIFIIALIVFLLSVSAQFARRWALQTKCLDPCGMASSIQWTTRLQT